MKLYRYWRFDVDEWELARASLAAQGRSDLVAVSTWWLVYGIFVRPYICPSVLHDTHGAEQWTALWRLLSGAGREALTDGGAAAGEDDGAAEDEDVDVDDDGPIVLVNSPYGPRNPRFQRASNADLIRQSLFEFSRMLTSEQYDALAFNELDARCHASSEAWIQVLVDATETLAVANPLSGALIGFYVEELPLPGNDAIVALIARLVALVTPKTAAAVACNVLLIVGFLAEQLAGPRAVKILSDDLIQLVMIQMENKDPMVVLSSLLAIEKLGQTGHNKERLLAAGASDVFANIEKRSLQDDNENGDDLAFMLVRAQLGFCAQWTLDNVFEAHGRQFTIDRLDLRGVNVMLDKADATPRLKLHPGGLEARNDSSMSFESVRATCSAQGGGLWYYEVTVFTGGIMQIGWATDGCNYQSDRGIGIGDDDYSFAYDGCRGVLWHQQKHPAHSQRWKPGDVLGTILDLDAGVIRFLLNGKLLDLHFRANYSFKDLRFYPAASLMTFQHLRFNFGNEPYRFQPTIAGKELRSLNDAGSMTEDQKKIVPRLLVLERLRKEREEEDNSLRCQICFSAAPDCILAPCRHAEFCTDCIAQCDWCPLCRGAIEDVQPLPATAEEEAAPGGAVAEGEGRHALADARGGILVPPPQHAAVAVAPLRAFEGFGDTDDSEYEDCDDSDDEDLISA